MPYATMPFAQHKRSRVNKKRKAFAPTLPSSAPGPTDPTGDSPLLQSRYHDGLTHSEPHRHVDEPIVCVQVEACGAACEDLQQCPVSHTHTHTETERERERERKREREQCLQQRVVQRDSWVGVLRRGAAVCDCLARAQPRDHSSGIAHSEALCARRLGEPVERVHLVVVAAPNQCVCSEYQFVVCIITLEVYNQILHMNNTYKSIMCTHFM
eukprot:COSAG03_NODE_871_length_5558_cov_34.833852_6_plen_212_part_00